MQSNEDFIEHLLDKMQGQNSSEALIDGLRIFTKLVNKYLLHSIV